MSSRKHRYVILAKHKDKRDWSVWAETDDINRVEHHLNKIREAGYDAKATDPQITEMEKKIAQGYLLETPVKIGETVYSVCDLDGEAFEVGCQYCLWLPFEIRGNTELWLFE